MRTDLRTYMDESRLDQRSIPHLMVQMVCGEILPPFTNNLLILLC